jgi:hypothetical protein
MKCKDCLLWRNEEEETRDQLVNFNVDTARWLGKKNPSLTLIKALDQEHDSLDRKWRRLWAISKTECPPGRCILISELNQEEHEGPTLYPVGNHESL